jgi:hypothetical protein
MREVSVSAIIPATLIARKAFYALGRSDVYTNNYRDCHTVKAYRTGSDIRDQQIIDTIVKLANETGYKNVSAHLTESSNGYTLGAMIVRIPK